MRQRTKMSKLVYPTLRLPLFRSCLKNADQPHFDGFILQPSNPGIQHKPAQDGPAAPARPRPEFDRCLALPTPYLPPVRGHGRREAPPQIASYGQSSVDPMGVRTRREISIQAKSRPSRYHSKPSPFHRLFGRPYPRCWSCPPNPDFQPPSSRA